MPGFSWRCQPLAAPALTWERGRAQQGLCWGWERPGRKMRRRLGGAGCTQDAVV